MSFEYVRVSSDEKSYGYKSLLHSQLGFLNLMKRFKSYRDLRNMEFSLKVSLKSKAADILADIEKLESVLPKTHFGEYEKKKDNRVEIKSPYMDEVNSIKEKLYRLQNEM